MRLIILMANDRSTVGNSEEKSRHLLNLFDNAKNQGIFYRTLYPNTWPDYKNLVNPDKNNF